MTSTERIARDARGERTRFEQIEIGTDLGSMEWRFTPDNIRRICESDDDFHEWYSVESPYGGTIAPTLINYPPVRLLFSRKYNVRGVFYWYEIENYLPLKPDVTYTLTGRIIEKWIKRDREFVKYEATCHDPTGRKMFYTTRTHALDYLNRTLPRGAVGIDSGAGGR